MTDAMDRADAAQKSSKMKLRGITTMDRLDTVPKREYG